MLVCTFIGAIFFTLFFTIYYEWTLYVSLVLFYVAYMNYLTFMLKGNEIEKKAFRILLYLQNEVARALIVFFFVIVVLVLFLFMFINSFVGMMVIGVMIYWYVQQFITYSCSILIDIDIEYSSRKSVFTSSEQDELRMNILYIGTIRKLFEIKEAYIIKYKGLPPKEIDVKTRIVKTLLFTFIPFYMSYKLLLLNYHRLRRVSQYKHIFHNPAVGFMAIPSVIIIISALTLVPILNHLILGGIIIKSIKVERSQIQPLSEEIKISKVLETSTDSDLS